MKKYTIRLISFSIVLVITVLGCGGGGGSEEGGQFTSSPTPSYVYISPVSRAWDVLDNTGASTGRSVNLQIVKTSQNEIDLNSPSGIFETEIDFEYDNALWELNGSFDGNQISITLSNPDPARTPATTYFTGTFRLVNNEIDLTFIDFKNTDPTLPAFSLNRHFSPQFNGNFVNVNDQNEFITFIYVPDPTFTDGYFEGDFEGLAHFGGIDYDIVDEPTTNEFSSEGQLAFTMENLSNGTLTNVSGHFTSQSRIELNFDGRQITLGRDCGNGINGKCLVNVNDLI